MQERRERAERAFSDAHACVLASREGPSSARKAALRLCRETARSAAEFSLELPENGGQQLELRTALDELARALESDDEQQLSSAVERSMRAGSALGWRVVHARLH